MPDRMSDASPSHSHPTVCLRAWPSGIGRVNPLSVMFDI